ncbi:hypothetical protein CDL12_28505 [Handroanthus impetiginosus]|uniref:CCHC-type domain-containing protein n=1 Tax=Handroanthus impetiginosus TaxID=429701 RepID=A0A2G9G103_9LAMI|nr:hypothetical protein CDL12_28505 [Handroanthus impetiginosus]
MKPDSSFMKWISNMVKGLSDSNKDESSSLTLTLPRSNDACGCNDQENNVCNKMDDCESPNMGFQSLFQSMYCRNTKMSKVHKDNSSKEISVANKNSLESLPQSCDNDIGNSCKQIILANKEVHVPTSKRVLGVCEKPLVENKASDLPVCNRAKEEGSSSDSLYKRVNSTWENKSLDVPRKSNPHASLWITRFQTRTPRLENCNQITEETRQCSIACPNVSLDSAEDQLHVSEQQASADETARKSNRLSEKLRNSEAMASVFAKRLDALRHITHPSGKRKLSTCTVMCFFCGGSGHDLRKCPELTETELEDLLVKISSFDKVEESHRLCIRCFQFDHWAASCPFRSSHKDRQKEQNLDVAKPCSGSSRKGLLTSYEYGRRTASTSETDLKDKQNFPLCNFGNVIAREEIFRAIRKLRLSRSDILRWMSSNGSLSHLEGFFLRLRLGKLETGLPGTSYHVACITGVTMENNGSNSKRCILADVGGIKSSVGSQYISNHDFLEDEIKAWWSRILKTGGKIPSLDELNSKFQDKKCLGF